MMIFWIMKQTLWRTFWRLCTMVLCPLALYRLAMLYTYTPSTDMNGILKNPKAVVEGSD
jgi:hypothetical protein